ncbi:MAG: HlyD family type I secretion periplasmic adaptor subunit [Paracoccaceae bacterium]
MTAIPFTATPFTSRPLITAGPVPNHSLKGPVRAGLIAIAVLVGILGTWTVLTMIAGAVIAQGQVMVKAQAQQVQSLEGGTVKAIMVQNGDHVRAGQIMVAFDPTLTAANLGIAKSKLADALALQARLRAEQQGLTQPDFTPPALPFTAPDLTAAAEGQAKIFAARAAVLQGQRDRLAETLTQYDTQATGLAGQIAAKRDEIDLTQAEVATQQKLLDQGLTRQSQLSELQRTHAGLLGEMAALQAEQAKIITARRDSTLETLQGERAFQEQVVTDLGDATAKVQELTLEIVTRADQLSHMEIRAPMDGIVHEMKVATLGGVVSPGATVLEVIPLGQGLSFEVQVDPRGIDQVHLGQVADLVLSSFDPRTTPRLKASVASVSPDAVVDQRSGRSFYRVELSLPATELARIGDQQLVPGMPITAYLATGDRSVLTYLLHPLTSQMAMAFRED